MRVTDVSTPPENRQVAISQTPQQVVAYQETSIGFQEALSEFRGQVEEQRQWQAELDAEREGERQRLRNKIRELEEARRGVTAERAAADDPMQRLQNHLHDLKEESRARTRGKDVAREAWVQEWRVAIPKNRVWACVSSHL